MSREYVWAYLQALGVEGGHQMPDSFELCKNLGQVKSWYPDFDQAAALERLQSLNVIKDEVILAALEQKESIEGRM